MRICDVTDAYHATSGGIRTYLDEKVRYLRSSTDCEHVLIVPADCDHDSRDGRFRVVGVRSPRLPGCGAYRLLLDEGRLAGLLDAIRPDVVELGNPYLKPRLARSNPGRYGGILAGYYHTDFPRAYVETTLRRTLGARAGRGAARAADRYTRHVHARLDLTLVGSEQLARHLRGIGVPRVEVLPLGVDTRTFHPDRRDLAWRRASGVLDGELLLVFAGRFDAEKRLEVLLGMTAHFPPTFPWKLLLIGDGPHRRRIEAAAAGNPRIRILPFERDRSTLARILASADVYVSAVRTETFGLSVLEAQAAGLPVVGQRAGAMPDRVPEVAGLLVAHPGPAPLAEAVLRLAREGPRTRGRAARRLAEAAPSWDRTFVRLLALYERSRAGSDIGEGRRAVS